MGEPIIISGEGQLSPRGREYWTSPEMVVDGVPTYTTSEVAKSFMARSNIWLRMRMWRGFGAQDDLGPIEVGRTEKGHRRWTLYEIERMARAFLMEHALTLADYAKTINVIKAQAYLYGYDLGDYDPMATMIPFTLSPEREKALKAVLNRLEAEDMGRLKAKDKEAADEHLVARTAWSLRDLEEYYRGIDA